MIAGVDEAGRGCLAGPVYAAAVILPQAFELEGLNDSKQISAKQREKLFPEIQAQAVAWAIGTASVEEIEQHNILQATFLAMRRAVEALRVVPVRALVDGNQAPALPCAVETIVDGDAKVPAIMAASILAKVARDREMQRLEVEYPGYGLAQHKGYGTPQHLIALERLGPTVIHRRGFAPIAQLSVGFEK